MSTVLVTHLRPGEILDLAGHVGVDTIQLHGRREPSVGGVAAATGLSAQQVE